MTFQELLKDYYKNVFADELKLFRKDLKTMNYGDEVRVDLPGNVFLVGEYRRTDMWGCIEVFHKGSLGQYIDTQLRAVANYYLKTDRGVDFSVDAGRVHLLSSKSRSSYDAKCECGSEAVGSSKHIYYCPKAETTAHKA